MAEKMESKVPGKRAWNKARNRTLLMEAASAVIAEGGLESVTVRSVCGKAGLAPGTFYHYFKDKDELLFFFLMERFDDSLVSCTAKDPAEVQISLYMSLLRTYQSAGIDFMKQFYTPNNTSLREYLTEQEGRFQSGSIMERSEEALRTALENGQIKNGTDVHGLSRDICTVFKGCVFEWCLSDGATAVEEAVGRLIGMYVRNALV